MQRKHIKIYFYILPRKTPESQPKIWQWFCNADLVSDKHKPEYRTLADGFLPVWELERHSTAQATSSLSPLVRDESPPTAIKRESFSCSSSQAFTKSTVYLQQQHRVSVCMRAWASCMCAHMKWLLMITKPSQGRRHNGLNLRQPFNEQIHSPTRLAVCVKTKKLNFHTDMVMKLLKFHFGERQTHG